MTATKQEVAKTEGKMSIKQVLNSDAMKQQFAAALPDHLSAERFCRIAITALSKTPKLMQCSQPSLFRCLLDLSAMGLEPDGRKAHLIPRGTECTLLVDYKGLVELVRRDPSVIDVQCFPIRQNDQCQVVNGVIEHSYSPLEDRGEIVAVYTKLTLKDGYVSYGEPMTRAEAEKVRSISPAKNSGPWVDHFDEMWKKTALRRSAKLWPLSPETEHHISKSDEEFDFGKRKSAPSVSATPGPRLTVDVESEAIDEPEPTKKQAKKTKPEPNAEREEQLSDMYGWLADEEITAAKFNSLLVQSKIIADGTKLVDAADETVALVHGKFDELIEGIK
jgi:recombination protein RecT